MSKKCVAFSKSKLGLEKPDNRKSFYAGWEAAIREALAEPVQQEPVACQFPRQPNNEGGWMIDAKFLNALVKDMADDEFAVGMEETEAVLLALERSYAAAIRGLICQD